MLVGRAHMSTNRNPMDIRSSAVKHRNSGIYGVGSRYQTTDKVTAD
jgi:hypothetical protein